MQLSCCLDALSLAPGEALTGTVLLRVTKPLPFIALRLCVEGKEITRILIDHEVRTEEQQYMNEWITFTGPELTMPPPQPSQLYEPGTYTFPFSVTLPTTLAPSAAAVTPITCAHITYSATAVLKRSERNEVTRTVPFRVVSIASQRQYHKLLAGRASAERVSKVYSSSWLCWGGGADGAASVRTSVKVQPALVALEGERPLPPLTAHVTVRNSSSTVIHHIEVRVSNRVHVQAEAIGSSTDCVVAKGERLKCKIVPGEQREIDVPLEVVSPLRFRTSPNEGLGLPLPSFSSRMLTSTYVTEVRYPSLSLAQTSAHSGLVDFVDRLVTMRGLRDIPVRFASRTRLLRESRYIATPAAIEFPEEDRLVYPDTHQPYLPRDDSAVECDDICEVGGWKTAQNIERHSVDVTAHVAEVAELSSFSSVSDVSSVMQRSHAHEEGISYIASSRSSSSSLSRQPVVATVVPGYVVCGTLVCPPQA